MTRGKLILVCVRSLVGLTEVGFWVVAVKEAVEDDDDEVSEDFGVGTEELFGPLVRCPTAFLWLDVVCPPAVLELLTALSG